MSLSPFDESKCVAIAVLRPLLEFAFVPSGPEHGEYHWDKYIIKFEQVESVQSSSSTDVRRLAVRRDYQKDHTKHVCLASHTFLSQLEKGHHGYFAFESLTSAFLFHNQNRYLQTVSYFRNVECQRMDLPLHCRCILYHFHQCTKSQLPVAITNSVIE